MNQTIKKRFMAGMAFVMICSLFGCKNNKDGKDLENKNNELSTEYGYDMSYEEIENLSNMSNITVKENTVYFTNIAYDEISKKRSVLLQSLQFSSPKDIKTYVSYESGLEGDVEIPYTYIAGFYPHENGITYLKMTVAYASNPENTTSIKLGDIPENVVITEEYIRQLGIDLEAVGLEFRDISNMTTAQVVELYKELLSDSSEHESFSAEMITIDSEGTKTASRNVTEQLKDGRNFTRSAYDHNGTFYFYYQKTQNAANAELENFLTIFHSDSLETETIPLGSTEIYGMTTTQAGEIAAVIMDKNNNFIAAKWDKQKNAFFDSGDSSLSVEWVNQIYPADQNSFYYKDESFLYRYDLDKSKNEKLLKFIDCNIRSNQIINISCTDENHINLITWEDGFQKNYLGLNRLTKVKASEIEKKTEITLACKNASETIEHAVIRFNKTNSKYKIIIDDTADYENEILKLHNEILSGNGPDLIDLSSLDYSHYKESGLFADIYEYIKKDADFSKKRLNENVLKLFELDGKLLALPITYTITALAFAKSTLDAETLTLDKFAELMENNPDKDMFSRFTTRESILEKLLIYNQNYFIDYEKKTCNFTDGNFEKILHIAKQFPTEQEIRNTMSEDDYIDIEEKRVYENKQLFYELNLDDLNKYQIARYIFGDEIHISGYPSVDGGQPSVYISPDFSYLFGINANSKYKEECWSFIKILYNQINEQGYYNGFPLDFDMLDELLTKYATPEMIEDENGNLIENPHIYNYNNELKIEIYAFSEEQTNTIRELANSAFVLALRDNSREDITDIVLEEAEAFFYGEKSAAEVCSVIQSRINIQINETM